MSLTLPETAAAFQRLGEAAREASKAFMELDKVSREYLELSGEINAYAWTGHDELRFERWFIRTSLAAERWFRSWYYQ